MDVMGVGGHSNDGGRTWTPFIPRPDFDGGLPTGYRREWHTPFFDQSTGRLITIVNAMDTPGVDPLLVEPPIALKSYYLRYRVSLDAGRTYLFDEPLVAAGRDPPSPLPGVQIGQNAVFMGDGGSQLIRLSTGEILVPAQMTIAGDDGELVSPGGGFTWTAVIVLIGTWRDDHRLGWCVSEPVHARPQESTRGFLEPTLVELRDGRLLMVMRGSNGGLHDPGFKIPGWRWMTTSLDGGRHWSAPTPMTLDDGVPFYSPSSMSQLLRHSSGRLYWIGNLTPENPRGNSPRWPLVIAEIDESRLVLFKHSIIVIDTRTDQDVDGVELSPHGPAIEDRQSGDIILPMLRFQTGYTSFKPMEYRIDVEQ